MFESMTKDLFRRARLPLDQACWQAGVDLGTAVKEYDDAGALAAGRVGWRAWGAPRDVCLRPD